MLRDAIRRHGAPEHVRSDNGPEFIAQVVRDALGQLGVATLYVEPGSPWQNGYAESFGSKLRDELLGAELFTSLAEAEVVSRDWQRAYNTRRPHSALGYQTPAGFAARFATDALAAPPAPPGCGNAGL